MVVEQIALDAYNLGQCVQNGSNQEFHQRQIVEPIGGRYLDNIEPATGRPYSQVADSDAHDIGRLYSHGGKRK